MFDFVNRKKRVVQVIMLLAVLPFMFWGVESYRTMDGETYVAIVDGEEIPRFEYEQALRDHHERMRSMMGANFDNAMLDSFEVRNSILERLIQQRLLQREAVKNGFAVLDSHLVRTIRDVPAFQQDNKFSKQQYEALLSAQGLTPVIFESRVRQELLLEQLLDGYSENGFAPKTVAERVRYLSEVKREISESNIDSVQFISQVVPDENDIKAYYEQHQSEFFLPERARIEYLVLSLTALAENEPVSDEAINTYFEEHKEEFAQPEERKASHILISVSADASEEERLEAEQKAENILEKLKQDPDQFENVAKENSDDPGSANRGGDLGFFGRGVMVKSFEDAIFSMQLNEISEIVETDFGLHIIRLVDIKEEVHPELENVRDQIEQRLQLQMVEGIFGETSEDFSNIVYEESDNLQSAAEKFDLVLQESDWITRNSAEPSFLSNEKLLSAIFSDDVIKNKRNTDAIEVQSDTFVSARIIEYEPATSQSLAIVKDEIIEKLKIEMAKSMAVEIGEEKLARLQANEDSADVVWSEAKQISYMQTLGLDHETLREIFRVDASVLPAYVGVENSKGGYTVIRISKVIEPESAEDEKLINFEKQLQQMITQEEVFSYMSALRQTYDVKIKQESFN